MSRTEDNTHDGHAAEEAARWFAHLQSEAATDSDWLMFERWLQAAPAHAEAYERLERLWVDLDYAPVAKELGGRPMVAARRALPLRPSARGPDRRVWVGAAR